MYVKIENNAVVRYPYSVAILKQENPMLTFPETKEMLESLGCFRVVVTTQPNCDHTQNIVELLPVFNTLSQCWEQQWDVVPASQQEIDKRTAGKEAEIRSERNKLLAECDWTQLADAPGNSLAWANYRQSLRDIPQQTGFPWEVIWPTKP